MRLRRDLLDDLLAFGFVEGREEVLARRGGVDGKVFAVDLVEDRGLPQ